MDLLSLDQSPHVNNSENWDSESRGASSEKPRSKGQRWKLQLGPRAQALAVSSGLTLSLSPQGQALAWTSRPALLGPAPAHVITWHVTAEKAVKGRLEPPCNPIFLDTPVFKKYWSCQNPSSQTLPICTFDCGM